MLRNHLNNMELGHKGPVLGAAHTFILARRSVQRHLPSSPIRRLSSATHPAASLLSALPLFLPALRLSEPSSSPTFLRAPLLLRVFPDLEGQRDGGQGVDLVRSGGAPAEMDGGSGSVQLQQVSSEL